MFYRFFVAFCFLMMCLSANAQFGIRTSYNLNQASAWDNFFSGSTGRQERIFSSSLSFTLDYWLKLPNHRIEFYPNLSFHSAQTTLTNIGVGVLDVPLGLRQIGIGVYTHVYLLDLIGDCDCPTFSKKGGLIKKGFFIVGGIGADYSQKNAVNMGYADGNVDFKASLGVGLDIGITDLVTVSPFLQYQYYPAVSWHELGQIFNVPDTDTEAAIGQLQLGVRVGFRPDYR